MVTRPPEVESSLDSAKIRRTTGVRWDRTLAGIGVGEGRGGKPEIPTEVRISMANQAWRRRHSRFFFDTWLQKKMLVSLLLFNF